MSDRDELMQNVSTRSSVKKGLSTGTIVLIIVLIILLFAVIGGLIWYFAYHNKPGPNPPTPPTPPPPPPPPGQKMLRVETATTASSQVEATPLTLGLKFKVLKNITVTNIGSRNGPTSTVFNIWSVATQTSIYTTSSTRQSTTGWEYNTSMNVPLLAGNEYILSRNYLPSGESNNLLYLLTLPASIDPSYVVVEAGLASLIGYPSGNTGNDYFLNFKYIATA